ncbi:MAG: peptidylprolyl isomerase [Ignavibacteriaceae bacterium]|nr:peptidylprolyl isomerase [Ignavibacteriaceae bacterium]
MFSEFILTNLINGNFSVAEIITSKIEPSDFADLKEELLEILILKANQGLNNPDYLEVHQNIYKLIGKFYPEILPDLVEIYSSSIILATKKLVSKESYSFDDAQFNLFWNNAFRYKGASVTTENHSFHLVFTPGYAPVSTGSFAYLSLTGGFNGTFFHRVVPGFVIQDGDPSGTGSGGPGYTIVSEFSPLPYLPYTLGMASAGRDTEGSQWFVTQGYYPHLNTNYTVFGKVVAGFDDVLSIPVKEKIVSIKLIPEDN